jgi:pyruvate, water dikinase
MPSNKHKPYIKTFGKVNLKDVASVGGKNASLGEMFQKLTPRGIRVPDGFAITADGYWRFLDGSGLRKQIKTIMKGLDAHNLGDLAKRGKAVREAIVAAPMPGDLAEEIREAYAALCKKYGANLDTAVRSSATAEDLPGASFAGQQETFLNIRGQEALLNATRRCFASLFTDRAIVYRTEKKFDHLKVALSVGVQQMVRSDVASAGVMFTIDTESGFKDAILINAAWGLGESVVQGKVNPDQYYVYKPMLAKGFKPIIGKSMGSKERKMIYSTVKGSPTKTIVVSHKERREFCLSDKEVLQLATWGAEIEKYYSKLSGHHEPMDIEWAKDGKTGKLYIVQARPETVQAEKDPNVLETYHLGAHGHALVTGTSIGSKIGKGRVRVIHDIRNIASFKDGEVLVTGMTDPDWVPVMKRASAIVTDSGGRTCHAAIVSRELGTPAVVGTRIATKTLKSGRDVTVSCAEGEEGKVYGGLLPFTVSRLKLGGLKRPKTQVLMNIGEPDMAFEQSFIPNDGVGLARTEFIFTDYIKAHPMALLHPEKVASPRVRRELEELTSGYKNGKEYFVSRLAEGIGCLAAAFYPKPVIVRTSDFKTNEYAKLVGGQPFEPAEDNPMIGWRGASRYYDPKYREAFLLECAAFRKVREEMGLTNVIVMIPFCRTPDEGKEVLKTMASVGLKQGSGKDGLKVYVMIEIPSNIILAEQYADLFDGFSIGSNDLTQLTLGVDRDSSYVAHLYNERNKAVYDSLSRVIRIAKKRHVKIGICGQAPSDFPEFAEFLVREGIDSISLNPDTVVKTTLRILKTEKKMKGRKGPSLTRSG